MTKRAALVLAGGKARRFQAKGGGWEDKALATLSGEPLLVHAVRNAQSIVDEVSVCVDDEERGARYTEVLKGNGLKGVCVVVDEKNDISGPTVAIMSGLRSVRADWCLTVPCDMPFLRPEVADYLFERAQGFDVATPMWPDGRLETLLTVLNRQCGLEITQTLCRLNRPRSDDIQRGAGKLLLVSPVNHIKTLDPELKSFININSKEDLNRLQTRRVHGPVKEDLELKLGALSTPDLQLLREGANMQRQGKLREAQDTFVSCAANFEGADSFFWAGVSREKQGEALLNMSQRQNDYAAAVELDFEGKEAYTRAVDDYRVEAEIHDGNRCRLLAERALADRNWCESWAMGKTGHTHRYPSKVA